MDITQNDGISSKDIGIKGEDYICMDNPLEPKCPPGNCVNDQCQECIASFQQEQDEPLLASNNDNLVNDLLLAIKDSQP